MTWPRWQALGMLALGALHAEFVGADDSLAGQASRRFALSPDLAAAAATHGIATDGIELATDGSEPAHGDEITLQIVHENREQQTQWLVHMQAKGDLPEGSQPTEVTRFYALDGRAIEFAPKMEVFEIAAMGPSTAAETASPPLRATVSEVRIDSVYLDEGFDRAAAFMHRVGEARRERRLPESVWFSVFAQPPRPPDVALHRRFAIEAVMSEDDERAFAATVPALSEFLRVVAGTPGLREMLFAIIEKPSLWSVLRRFGRIESEFRFLSGEIEAVAEPPPAFAGVGRCFWVPFRFSLNDQPALFCTMLVTSPRPPLRTSAGILMLSAAAPDRPSEHLIVRVIAARPGPRPCEER